MAVDVKWNLEDATAISVLSDWSIIRIEKMKKRWRHWVDVEVAQGIERRKNQFFNDEDLPELLENYERAGCIVLVAAPKKDVLKLGTKMIEVPIQKAASLFDWKDVHHVFVEDEDGDFQEYMRVNDVHFKRRYQFKSGDTTLFGDPVWRAYEVDYYVRDAISYKREIRIFDINGEAMTYDK